MNATRLIALTALFAAGCADATTPPDESPVTFWDDVAPIYFDRCVTCHREGGVAPFALDSFEDARDWAEASVAATQARTMPPWLVTDDGSCGSFRDSRALTDDERDAIARWVADGTEEGTPRDDLSVAEEPGLVDGHVLMTPMFTPEIQGGPLAEFDEYRCFAVDPGLDRDMMLTGFDVVPGNDAIVHHVVAMVVDPDLDVGGMTNRERITALEQDSPGRDGWPCFTGAGDGVVEDGVPVVWAPGQRVIRYPDGLGIPLRASDMIVIQVHYNLANPDTIGQSDQTMVRLEMAESAGQTGMFAFTDGLLETLFSPQPAQLEPGRDAVTYSWQLSMDEVLADLGLPRVALYGVFPHMHERGRKIQLRIASDDADQCAVDIQRWDFGWQLLYFFQEPIVLEPGMRMEVTCEYNTQGATEPITPGWGTHNEMCSMGVMVGL